MMENFSLISMSSTFHLLFLLYLKIPLLGTLPNFNVQCLKETDAESRYLDYLGFKILEKQDTGSFKVKLNIFLASFL